MATWTGGIRGLPDNARGALWIILGCIMFSAMTMAVKFSGRLLR